MTQADSVHSTPPKNTSANNSTVSSRRGFLAPAAGVAATGTALALAAPPARAAADPVFALIETHKGTEAALAIACTEKGRLEFGDWGADGGTEAAHQAEWAALADVMECVPTTLAGVTESLTYAGGLAEREYGRIDDELITVLLANLAEALQRLAVRA